MLRDLSGAGAVSLDAPFVIIGAGTVGLPFALKLADQTGQRVIVVESGGEEQAEETHPLNRVVQKGQVYEGAEHGRFRCLGGTSTRWGGALIPLQPADLQQAGWPITFDDLATYVPQVEALFGLEPGAYADPAFPHDLGTSHVNRLAKWPEFAKRNTWSLVGAAIRQHPKVEIWTNATVTQIGLADGGVQLQAVSPAGDTLAIGGEKLIVAAGAIETTRLTLLIDRQNGSCISTASPALGRYFTDHISVVVGELAAKQLRALNRIIGFRFGARGAMRNIRFELAPSAPARADLPPGFAHIGFESEQEGGFDVLREILRAMQRRRLPALRHIWGLVCNAPWLLRAVWWRLVEKRLLFPAGARLQLHMVAEQEPRAKSRITLSESETDPHGQPLAEIDWQVSDSDVANVVQHAQLFAETWNASGMAGLGEVTLHDPEKIGSDLAHSGGIYHPTGSTRMGSDAAAGVVDRDLRLFAAPQVQLLSTSVLPTGGGANPTMMLMLLAMRCAAQHGADN